MKKFYQTLKRQDGFTLVELMVVVAIIGLLSAVAIPNFRKYQAKSKMSEAKLQLSSIYTAETAFFSDFNMYAQCLPYMGYDPALESAARYYATGFVTPTAIAAAAYASAVSSGLLAADCPDTNASTPGGVGAPSANNATWFAAGKGIGASIASVIGYLPAATTTGTQADAANMTFLAGAGGVISVEGTNGAAGTNSQLTINQLKTITVVRNGF